MFLRNLWNDKQGQDLIEYILVMVFMALVSAAFFVGAGGNFSELWKQLAWISGARFVVVFWLGAGAVLVMLLSRRRRQTKKELQRRVWEQLGRYEK